jgi:hypothetical protein
MSAKNKKSNDIFKNTVINNDLKKYQDHPLVIKKAEKAMELLSKVKNLQSIL